MRFLKHVNLEIKEPLLRNSSLCIPDEETNHKVAYSLEWPLPHFKTIEYN